MNDDRSWLDDVAEDSLLAAMSVECRGPVALSSGRAEQEIRVWSLGYGVCPCRSLTHEGLSSVWTTDGDMARGDEPAAAALVFEVTVYLAAKSVSARRTAGSYRESGCNNITAPQVERVLTLDVVDAECIQTASKKWRRRGCTVVVVMGDRSPSGGRQGHRRRPR